MSEINGPKISVNQINYSGLQKQASEVPAETTETTPQITDFSNSQAEALGRSMLFKGSDNINNDLKALIDSPQIAENSDRMFEAAYAAAQAAGLENPYEEATRVSTTAV